MAIRIEFNVPGMPVPKGRPRFGNGRTFTPKRTVLYEKLVLEQYRKAANRHGIDYPTDKPVILYVDAYFPIPGSAKRKTIPDKINAGDPFMNRPDLDNIEKSILDALNGEAYLDDKQVYCIISKKTYAEYPYVSVCVEVEDVAWRS